MTAASEPALAVPRAPIRAEDIPLARSVGAIAFLLTAYFF